jgi:uncharacterized protein (DUF427 family)
VKTPGPEHPIAIAANPNRVVVSLNGRRIADTVRALTMREANYPPVHYIPRADVDMSALARSQHSSHCPYKGDAAYYTIAVGGRLAENAVWSYEQPYSAVGEIAGYLAFYPDRVDAIEERSG